MFFFFKQKTAYEIKECDWSSDVCSSDLTISPIITCGFAVYPCFAAGCGIFTKFTSVVPFFLVLRLDAPLYIPVRTGKWGAEAVFRWRGYCGGIVSGETGGMRRCFNIRRDVNFYM